MTQILGLICLLLVVAGIAINGFCMLISPRAWLHLPEWFPGPGSMRLKKKKYSSGLGSIQVRLMGAIFLSVIFWCFWHSIHFHK